MKACAVLAASEELEAAPVTEPPSYWLYVDLVHHYSDTLFMWFDEA